MRMTRQVTATLLVLALFLVACGGDGDDADATPVGETSTAANAQMPTRRPSPEATSTPSTGVAAVDATLAAVRAGGAGAIADLIEYAPVACAVTQTGAPSRPECAPGDADGTPIDAFFITQCEGAYVARRDAVDAVQVFIDRDLDLYAVYRAPAGHFIEGAAYVIVYRANAVGAAGLGQAIVLSETGIVALDYRCGGTAARLVADTGLVDAIIPPSP
jgi:hypothetical protein